MKRNKHLIATLLGLLALGWAGHVYASFCPEPTNETVTLELVGVTSDSGPGDTTPYQGAVVTLTVNDPGSSVSLQIAKNQGPAIVEKYNESR